MPDKGGQRGDQALREEQLSSSEVKARAIRSTLTVAVRGVSIRALGLLGNIVLARLLAPDRFGLLALGFTFVTFGSVVSSGGIAAALIRRERPPGRDELQAVLALQLLVCLSVCALAGAGAALLGTAAGVGAIMACSLPIDAARTPATVMAERRLDYRRLVRSEILEIVAYNVFAIAGVLAGGGVWAVAIAVVARSLVGTGLVVTGLTPGLLRPRWSWAAVRPILRFGLTLQSASWVNLARDQGLVVLTGALAGLATVGYWAIVSRLGQVIFLVLDSLWRVSYPAVARLMAAGDDLRAPLQRALQVSAVVTGGAGALLGGTAPALVPLLFGEAWRPAVAAVALTAAGLVVSGPISTTTAGLLLARGRVGWVLKATVAHTIAWFAVTAPLLPVLGVTAVGIGACVAACVDGILLASYARREVDLRFVRSLRAPLASALVAGGGAWWLATAITPTAAATVAAAAAGAALYLGSLALLSSADLRDAGAVLRRAVRRGITESPAAAGDVAG